MAKSHPTISTKWERDMTFGTPPVLPSISAEHPNHVRLPKPLQEPVLFDLVLQLRNNCGATLCIVQQDVDGKWGSGSLARQTRERTVDLVPGVSYVETLEEFGEANDVMSEDKSYH